MQIEARLASLRDGRQLEIITPGAEDGVAMLSFMKSAFESPYLSSYPEEFSLTLEQEEEYLARSLTSDTSLLIVAKDGEKIVASCNLVRKYNRVKLKHRGAFSISVLPDYQGCGLGRILSETVISFAGKLGFTQVELEVVEANEVARALYRKLGFVETGRIPSAMILKDGTVHDYIIMVKALLKP